MENGISPLIDSCLGLIHKQAVNGYRRLAWHDKRWTDPEDILQEAFLTALETERNWREGAGNKFSTHLYRALAWRTNSILSALTHEKRGGITWMEELDAPVVSSEGTENRTQGDLVADPDATAEDPLREAQRGFRELFRAVGQRAKAFLVRGFLARRRTRKVPGEDGEYREIIYPVHADRQIREEVLRAARKLRIGMDDIVLATQEENSRRELLTFAGECATMGLETEAGLRVLECIECEAQFTLGAIRTKQFFPLVMTCASCLAKMAKDPGSCFGKSKTSTREGYSAEDPECRLYCMDRKSCRNFVKTERHMTTKAHKFEIQAVADTGLDDLEKELAEVDTKAAAKSATAVTKTKKKAKVAAAKKAVAKQAKAVKKAAAPKIAQSQDGPAPPKGIGEWPWRPGSMLQWAFQTVHAGIETAAFKKAILKARDESSLKFVMGCLRSGKAPSPVQAGPKAKDPNYWTHKWDLDESDGFLKIHNLRFRDIKSKERAAKKAASAKSEVKSVKKTKTKTKTKAKAKQAKKAA